MQRISILKIYSMNKSNDWKIIALFFDMRPAHVNDSFTFIKGVINLEINKSNVIAAQLINWTICSTQGV